MHNYILLTIYNLDTTFEVMEGQVRGPGVCSALQLLAGSYLRAGSPLGCFLPVIWMYAFKFSALYYVCSAGVHV